MAVTDSSVARACPRCGKPRHEDAPAGLCPYCVLTAALQGFEDSGARPCTIGDYELIEEIARGGMGVVYRARQRSLDRLVAVKLILVGQWASPSQIQRFRAEAAAAAKLDHPNIVPLYEVGEATGQHFFSMKLVEGKSLAGPLMSRDAAQLVACLARAVHYAHQRGVLHRDLKPSNILIAQDGQPFVTDFGLAKIFESDTGASVSAELLGTPAYLAPEMAGGGGHITTAADIYSLGAILYELLAGRPPFAGEGIPVILRKIVEDEPPPLACPRDLQIICFKCLSKEPARRYGSPEALAEDLERWLANEPIQARPVPATERLRLWARRKPVVATLSLAVVTLVAITAIVSSVMAWRIARERDRATALADDNRRQLVELNLANGLARIDEGNYFESLPWLVEALRLETADAARQNHHRIRLASVLRELPRPARMFFHEQPVLDAALSPDHWRVATAAGSKVFIWNLATGKLAVPPLEHSRAAVSQLAFSPDGSRLLAVCGNEAQLWEVATGKPIGPRLTHQYRINHGVFTPDGLEVLTAGAERWVRRWSAVDGEPIGPPLELAQECFRLAISPQGKQFVTASVREETRLRGLADWNSAGHPLAHSWAALDAAFSPDGARVATAGDDTCARVWETASGSAGPSVCHSDRVTGVAFSSDGKRLLTASSDHTAKILSFGTSDREPLVLTHAGAVNRAVFSPDSTRVATASADNSARVWDAINGQPLTPPLPHNNEVLAVQFSADGKRLLTASADGVARVWELPTTTFTQKLFRDSWWFRTPPALSANGRFALLMDVEQLTLVWDLAAERVVSPLMNHPKPVHRGAVTGDGSRAITLCYDAQGRVWDTAPGKVLLSTTIPFNVRNLPPVLSSDRQRLLLGDEVNGLHVWNIKTGVLEAKLPRTDQPPLCGAFSPDGGRVAVGARDRTVRIFNLRTQAEAAVFYHEAPVTAVAFSGDGNRLASGDESGRVQVWSGFPALNHPRRILALCFSPQGDRLLTACEDGGARLWNVATGKLLTPPMKHARPVIAVVFSPDARRAITVDNRLDPQLWELGTGRPLTVPRWYNTRMGSTTLAATNGGWNWALPSDPRSLEALELEARVLSGGKLDKVSGRVPLERDEFKTLWGRFVKERNEGKEL